MDQNLPAAEPVSEPWAEIAAELHRIADDLLTLIGEPAPCMVAVNIQPYTPDQIDRAQVKHRAATVSAVDAVTEALVGKAATTYPLSGGSFHHGVRGDRGRIELGIYQSVADPQAVDADEEIARLRARVAELEANPPAEPEVGVFHCPGTVAFGPNMRFVCGKDGPHRPHEYGQVSADPTGQLYSRADDGQDDPTPPGPREPLHTGGMTEGGLVDETPEQSAAIVDRNLRAMGSAGLGITDRCPKCNHWPFTGRHGEQGCFATGGTDRICGCTYADPS